MQRYRFYNQHELNPGIRRRNVDASPDMLSYGTCELDGIDELSDEELGMLGYCPVEEAEPTHRVEPLLDA